MCITLGNTPPPLRDLVIEQLVSGGQHLLKIKYYQTRRQGRGFLTTRTFVAMDSKENLSKNIPDLHTAHTIQAGMGGASRLIIAKRSVVWREHLKRSDVERQCGIGTTGE